MGKKGKFRGVLIASVMAGSLLQAEEVAKAEGRVAEPATNAMIRLAATDISSYKDFDANAGWAPAMRWAIDKEVISGYRNQKHPSDPKKGVGNWLDPHGHLTEYQMLTILLKYQAPDSLKREKANTTKADLDKNFAFAEYELAKDLGMVTKGSTTNATPASQQVTRGQMAQALVSLQYGKSVTLEQAVEFMYANNLTTGKDPAKGQTLDNFGTTDKLTRAQMAAFIMRVEKIIAQTQKFPFEYVDTSKNTLKPGVHWNWPDPIKDYIFDNNGDTFSTLEVDKNIKITIYNSQSKKLSEKTLALELPLFGTFYSGEIYNYIAYGQNNPKEENIEVIRIVKYDKNFNRIAATSVKGDEIITVTPFDASSGGRIAEQGDTLAFHTSRGRYKSSDGLNHQSQLTIEINTSSMEIINKLGEFQGNHVGHSFDQYVLMDGEAPVYLDHGDGYPRSLVLNKLTNISSNKRDRYSKKEFFYISGDSGDNVTGVSIGGFEQSSTHYLAAFNSVNQGKHYYRNEADNRNVYLYGISKDFSNTSDSTIIETTIANYENTAMYTTTPTLVKITDDKFVVLWQEYLDDEIGSLKYVYVDGQGIIISSTYTVADMELSTVQPIVKNNKIIWYTSSNSKKVVYELEIE